VELSAKGANAVTRLAVPPQGQVYFGACSSSCASGVGRQGQ
jgi:hypothetical protein